MSNPNIRFHIQRDQLTWFLDLLLDEREIFELNASAGIVLDVDRLYTLSRRELLVNLADVFLDVVGTTKSELKNPETSLEAHPHDDRLPSEVNTLVSQFLTEKAQAAISRVGYMEISEIETFFKTSDVLIEGGDFGEVIWALLTDQRTAVVEHGYKLLNTTYESIEMAHTNGSGDLHNAEQCERIDAQSAYDTDNGLQHSETPDQDIEHLERQLADSKSDYTSLEQRHNQLDQQRALLLEENKGLKTKTEAIHGNEKRLKALEQENHILREQIAQYIDDTAELQHLSAEHERLLAEKDQMAEQLREYEQIKAAKETFSTDLKLVEEAIYKGHQGLEDFQTTLDSHFDILENSRI